MSVTQAEKLAHEVYRLTIKGRMVYPADPERIEHRKRLYRAAKNKCRLLMDELNKEIARRF